VGLPPIGAPIDNAQVYIVDENLQPVPDGVAGEMFVGGANVGRGYRNHPELTAERFVANPFVPGTKLYRTGDLGRRFPDGQIAFLGRVDNQIKIRGYRIEPGEIAAAMNAHPSVSASAVMARADGADEKHLVGYVVGNGDLTRGELQGFLLDRLPDYMVPSVFVVLDSLPLTANGKVDYSALPLPTSENMLRDEPAAASSAGDELRVLFSGGQAWLLRSLESAAGYSAAIAVEGGCADVKYLDFRLNHGAFAINDVVPGLQQPALPG